MKSILHFSDSSDKIIIPKNYTIKNVGFKNIKNNLLKYHLEISPKVKYDKRKHIKVCKIGYDRSLQQLDKLGKSRWISYFSNGYKIYFAKSENEIPIIKRILLDKKGKEFIIRGSKLPLKLKPQKREYKFGGKNGKINGFNFYLNDKDKLSKRERFEFIKRGNTYFEEVKNIIKNNFEIGELDRTHTDIELMNEWNLFFEKYGNHIKDFDKQWNKLYLKELSFGSKLSVNSKKGFKVNILDKFNPIRNKITGMD
jgi:hypothetical protein